MQPRGDRLAHGVDPQLVGGIEKTRSVEQCEGTDVLRPTLAYPQHQPVQ
jgi:hypothetical protein